jgi:hypothetical protein
MSLNNMTRKQITQFDNTIDMVRSHLGSFHSIALRIYSFCDREVTGETVRNWFYSRSLPPEIAFALYEICDENIDPLTLVPWLQKYVELKGRPDTRS